MRRLDWRAYMVQADMQLRAMSRATWQALKTRRSALPELAGRPVRVVYAFVLRERGKPILLVALEGTVWRLDDAGRVDYAVPEFDERRIGLATAFAADVLPDVALQTGDRWRPAEPVRERVVAQLWPRGEPDLRPQAALPVGGERPALDGALAAVGKAGTARAMARLVEELSLSQQTTQRLMAALALEPQNLRDLIVAEAGTGEQVH